MFVYIVQTAEPDSEIVASFKRFRKLTKGQRAKLDKAANELDLYVTELEPMLANDIRKMVNSLSLIRGSVSSEIKKLGGEG